MVSPAPVRSLRLVLSVLCVAVLVSCAGEPVETTGSITKEGSGSRGRTATTVRRADRGRPTSPTTVDGARLLGGEVDPEKETPVTPTTEKPTPTTVAPVTRLTQPPVTGPPVTDPPVTDPPVTDPPATDPPRPTTFYYLDCESARAAGAAPLYFGYEGYWAALDPDGDGVACDT